MFARIILTGSLACLLAACGGGGGEPDAGLPGDSPESTLVAIIPFQLSGFDPPTETLAVRIRGDAAVEVHVRDPEEGVRSSEPIREGPAFDLLAAQLVNGASTPISVDIDRAGVLVQSQTSTEEEILVRTQPGSPAGSADLTGFTVTAIQCQSNVSHGQQGGYGLRGAIAIFAAPPTPTASTSLRPIGICIAPHNNMTVNDFPRDLTLEEGTNNLGVTLQPAFDRTMLGQLPLVTPPANDAPFLALQAEFTDGAPSFVMT